MLKYLPSLILTAGAVTAPTAEIYNFQKKTEDDQKINQELLKLLEIVYDKNFTKKEIDEIIKFNYLITRSKTRQKQVLFDYFRYFLKNYEEKEVMHWVGFLWSVGENFPKETKLFDALSQLYNNLENFSYQKIINYRETIDKILINYRGDFNQSDTTRDFLLSLVLSILNKQDSWNDEIILPKINEILDKKRPFFIYHTNIYWLLKIMNRVIDLSNQKDSEKIVKQFEILWEKNDEWDGWPTIQLISNLETNDLTTLASLLEKIVRKYN